MNFIVGQLAAGITADATTLTLASAQGARWLTVATQQWPHVIWDASSFSNPADAFWSNAAEIVTVTGRSSDTLTIVRAQEGTTARAFNTPGKTYRIALMLTGATFQYFGPPAQATMRVNLTTGNFERKHPTLGRWYPLIAIEAGSDILLTLDQTYTT